MVCRFENYSDKASQASAVLLELLMLLPVDTLGAETITYLNHSCFDQFGTSEEELLDAQVSTAASAVMMRILQALHAAR